MPRSDTEEQLFTTVWHGAAADVEMMLQVGGMSPNTATVDKRTLLHLAAGATGHPVPADTDRAHIHTHMHTHTEYDTGIDYGMHVCNAAVVDVLLAHGATVSNEDVHGMSALHWASLKGLVPVALRLLAARGISIDQQDGYGCSALHHACLHGHQEMTRILLRNKASVTLVDNTGCTALHHSCGRGFCEVSELLVEANADVRVKAKSKYLSVREDTAVDKLTPLHVAARAGHTTVVRMLLTHGAHHSDRDSDGFTAMHLAAMYNRHEVVGLFLAEGVAVDIFRSSDRTTPLHLAVSTSSTETVALLLDNGADPSMPDNLPPGPPDGETPLCYAVEAGDGGVVQLILEAVVRRNQTTIPDPTRGDNDCAARRHPGTTTPKEALYKGSTATTTLKEALYKGSTAHERNLGGTILHQAAAQSSAAVVRILVNTGAVVDAADLECWTPLHRSVHASNIHTTRVLLENGADVNAETACGITALHLAVSNGETFIVDMLIEAHADMNHKHKDSGNSALHMVYKTVQHKEDPHSGGSVTYHSSTEASSTEANSATDPTEASSAEANSATDPTDVYDKIVSRLLGAGALVDGRNNRGQTPLHVAVTTHCDWGIARLLDAGANPLSVDRMGDSPLRCYMERTGVPGDPNVTVMLQDAAKSTRRHQATTWPVLPKGPSSGSGSGKFVF
jgi:ankyrin repeat protein